VWSNDKSNSYGVRESSSKIKIFQNFKETKIIRPSFTAEGVFGGTLLAVRSTSFVTFYDWEGRVVRKIDVVPKAVHTPHPSPLLMDGADVALVLVGGGRGGARSRFIGATAATW
jgi:coatomer subunit beta'